MPKLVKQIIRSGFIILIRFLVPPRCATVLNQMRHQPAAIFHPLDPPLKRGIFSMYD